MSVSVSAAPFLLIYAVGSGVMSLTSAVISSQFIKTETSGKMLNRSAEKLHLTDETLEKEIFNKEFPTAIVDQRTLIKTLEEHGASNIQTNGNTISCDCEAFHITFSKEENDKEKPYTMVISYNNEYGLNELVDNLGSEYASNAQEISYNKIKERLEKQNLKIEEEEVFDDNTIVLTVNLE